jgi:hypothetical protein
MDTKAIAKHLLQSRSDWTIGFAGVLHRFAESTVDCQHCGESVERDEYNSETDECNYCHDAGDPWECRCERCTDRLAGAADALYDRMREDG